MKELIEAIVRALVDDESAVKVEEHHLNRSVMYEINVADADYGKLIGAKGAHVNAIRTIIGSAGRKLGKSVSLEIDDPLHRPDSSTP